MLGSGVSTGHCREDYREGIERAVSIEESLE